MARFLEDRQHFGLAGAFWRLLYFGVNRIGRLRILDCLCLTEADLPHALLRAETPYQFRFVEPAELRRFAKDPENRLEPEFVEQALLRKERCFGVFDGDSLASYGWYTTEPTRVRRSLVVSFPPGWVYMYRGYTRPRYRGERLHSLGLVRAADAHIRDGYRGVVSNLERNNLASRRSVARMGFRYVGAVWWIGVGPWAWLLHSPGTRDAGFRFEQERA